MNTKIIKRVKASDLDRKDCYICNKYGYFTQLHHLILISDMDKILVEVKKRKKNYEKYFNYLCNIKSGIWLCPNHHTLYHKLLGKQNIEIALMMSNDEKAKYLQIFEYSKKLYEKIIKSLLKIGFKQDKIKNIIKRKDKIEQTLLVMYEMTNN